MREGLSFGKVKRKNKKEFIKGGRRWLVILSLPQHREYHRERGCFHLESSITVGDQSQLNWSEKNNAVGGVVVGLPRQWSRGKLVQYGNNNRYLFH